MFLKDYNELTIHIENSDSNGLKGTRDCVYIYKIEPIASNLLEMNLEKLGMITLTSN